MSWRGIDALTHSREVAQQRLAQTERLQTVLAQWETDLRALQDSKSEVPPLSFDGGTSRSRAKRQRACRLSSGACGKAPSTAGQCTTAHRCRGGQRTPARQQALAQRSQALLALQGVASWQFYCYRGNAWANCPSSGDEAAPDNKTPALQTGLPTGLRMQMQFAPGARPQRQPRARD